MIINIDLSIFITVLLGIGFGLPIAMVVLYCLQNALSNNKGA